VELWPCFSVAPYQFPFKISEMWLMLIQIGHFVTKKVIFFPSSSSWTVFNNIYFFKGSQAFYLFKATDGDPDYLTYYKRIKKGPIEDHTFFDIEEGLEMIKTTTSVLHVPFKSLKGHFR